MPAALTALMSNITMYSHSAAFAQRSIRQYTKSAFEPENRHNAYLWIDATYVKVREAGRIVSAAVIIAVSVNTNGGWEILGMRVGPPEAEPFWTDFLRSLMRRGLRRLKPVISDAHEGLKAAVAKVLHATWQRCRVHFMRNAMPHVGKGQRGTVAALLRTVFAQDNRAECHQQ